MNDDIFRQTTGHWTASKREVGVSDVAHMENNIQTRQLTSSDAGYASREVADDDKGLVFADEGEVDVVFCEVGGELFYTASARRKQ